MPTIDDVYGVMPPSSDFHRPEIVPAPIPAVKVDALALFVQDPAGLKHTALKVLDIKIQPVETPEQAIHLADTRAQVKTLLKNIEARRKQIVEPLNQQKDAVQAEYHRWVDPVTAWDKKAESMLLAYDKLAEDRRRRAEEERQKQIREAAERQALAEGRGDLEQAEAASVEIMKAETEAAPPLSGYKTDHGTTTKRKVWKVEIVDPLLVPENYLVPDLKLLQAAVDGGARDIPGCNVWQEESLPVRTR